MLAPNPSTPGLLCLYGARPSIRDPTRRSRLVLQTRSVTSRHVSTIPSRPYPSHHVPQIRSRASRAANPCSPLHGPLSTASLLLKLPLIRVNPSTAPSRPRPRWSCPHPCVPPDQAPDHVPRRQVPRIAPISHHVPPYHVPPYHVPLSITRPRPPTVTFHAPPPGPSPGPLRVPEGTRRGGTRRRGA